MYIIRPSNYTFQEGKQITAQDFPLYDFTFIFFLLLTQMKDKIVVSVPLLCLHHNNFDSSAWDILYFPPSGSENFVFLHIFYRVPFHHKPFVCIQACDDEQDCMAVRSQA